MFEACVALEAEYVEAEAKLAAAAPDQALPAENKALQFLQHVASIVQCFGVVGLDGENAGVTIQRRFELPHALQRKPPVEQCVSVIGTVADRLRIIAFGCGQPAERHVRVAAAVENLGVPRVVFERAVQPDDGVGRPLLLDQHFAATHEVRSHAEGPDQMTKHFHCHVDCAFCDSRWTIVRPQAGAHAVAEL